MPREAEIEGSAVDRPGPGAPKTGRRLSVRVRRPERMDDPGLDPAEHRRALRGLTRLNAISHTVGHLWQAIRKGVGDRPAVPLRILDAACGAGDIALWSH